MYTTELAHVIEELDALSGAHRGQVWQPHRDHLVVELGPHRLAIVTGSGRARLHLTRRRPRQPKMPFSFQGACRAHLGGVLTGARMLAPNRAVELEFGRTTLHVRLFGRGLCVLLRDGVPLAAMHGPPPDALPPLGAPPGTGRPPRFEPREGESWNDAADRFFGDRERARRRQELLGQVRRRLVREVQRCERLIAALEGDLEASERAPLLRAQADVLAANLHRVHRGAERITLPSFEDPDVEFEIALDPRLGPPENLNRLYQKARRLDRAGDRVLERLDHQETRLGELRAIAERLEALPFDELEALDRTLPRQQSTREHGPRQGWDTWLGPDGMRLRVGKNEKANRALCFSVSKGRDWWLHLRDAPGAHVVLSLGSQQSPPLPALLAGAELVLTAARVPVGSSADVQYTQIKHLRPIPGEESARVRIAQEKVLRVQRDPAQLDAWVRLDP
ncbi:MAG: DUF814 domain-containing protein [Deltaproteobacteria bacterium]|nr:MAG: DUF814 domain-containing protein [Deltaproteobacteria bacterium]